MQIKMVKEGMTTIINHNVAAINNVAAISSDWLACRVFHRACYRTCNPGTEIPR